MDFIDPEIEDYAHAHTTPESELVAELIEASRQDLEHIDMLSGRVVGRFLAMMVRTSGAKRVLEVGTFSGFSALSMAEALPADGKLITCEYNERYEKLARSFFEKSEHGHKIELRMGPALETIAELEETFDLVFLDADKINYPNYFEAILPKMKRGGLMIIDNVLWSGAVLDPDDEKSAAIDRLNRMLVVDERVEEVMLTVRDGITLVRKR